MEKVKAGLRGLTANEKVVRGHVVLKAMTGNAAFPNPEPTMAALEAACDELNAANVAALDRGRMACARKRAAIKVLDQVLSRLAAHVNSVCAGDIVKLGSSGFPLASRPSPISELPRPNAFRAARTQFSDRLELRWESVPGALIYEVEMAERGASAESAWLRAGLTSKPRLLVEHLKPGRSYTFRVCAVGAHVQSPYSQEAYGAAA